MLSCDAPAAAYMAAAFYEGRANIMQVAKSWFCSFFGNLTGSLLVVWLLDEVGRALAVLALMFAQKLARTHKYMRTHSPASALASADTPCALGSCMCWLVLIWHVLWPEYPPLCSKRGADLVTP